jgi:hypothetical protein
VLQQGGSSPAFKSDGDSAIDTSGEAEADAVEAAVGGGKPASSALSHGGHAAHAPARKIARKEEGGKFGMGMSFSKEGFEKSYTWTLWEGNIPDIPTPVPGVTVKVEPKVVVKGKMGANYAGENKGNLSLGLGVEGSCLVALAGGVPNVAQIYGGLEGSVAGEATFNSQTAPEEHKGPESSTGGGGGGHSTAPKEGGGQEKTESKPGGWNLNAGLSVSAAIKVGVMLGPNGMIDNSIELGKAEIFKLTGIYFDQGGFQKSKLGFEWGKEMQEAFQAVKAAWEKAKNLAAEGWSMVKKGASGVYNGAKHFMHWVTSW